MTFLGKSSRRPDGSPVSLLQHTLEVVNAGEWLFGTSSPTRLGQAWLRFFKIAQERWGDFRLNLLASAAFHDWGKANDGMQAVLHRQPGQQIIRHEHLSALMLGLDGVADWVAKRPGVDWDLVLASVLCHHLKGGYKDLDDRPTTHFLLQLHQDHQEFRDLLNLIAGGVGLPKTFPSFPPRPFWAFRDLWGKLPGNVFDLEAHREYLRQRRLRPFEVALRKNEDRRRMLWGVRAALIAADAVGSALPREGLDLRSWIQDTFDEARLCDGNLIANLIDERIRELGDKWKGWSEFQDECADLSDRALLLAPCGSGKTLAAWRWIAAQLARPVARVIFLYPTRATAKEGFRDYVSWAPEADAALMHGTAEYDLEGMFINPDDPRYGNLYETDRRLYALRFWTRRVFSATVDQFLAFMQYTYGPVCLLPLLVDSVVVVDEVHSYDRSMFSALKDFLKTFDVPVLCMTATLANDRRQEMAAVVRQVYEGREGDLKTISEAPRYRVRRTGEGEVEGIVREALQAGRRVLWVVNQVKRAQQAARRMACDFDPGNPRQAGLHVAPNVPLFCYHSRFRLSDRVQRHNEVVEAFRPNSPAALAITTQVCEMSLDMDADLLVTEECPITALIQRMGRCNRQRTPRAGAGDVLVYQPLDEHGRPDRKPYDDRLLTGLEGFLADLSGHERLSQADLEQGLARAPVPPALGDKDSGFLTSGPYARGGEEDFRDIEEFAVQVVLAGDVASFDQLRRARKPAEGLILPVPRSLGRGTDPRLPNYLGVADNGHYHGLIGFCDEPLRS